MLFVLFVFFNDPAWVVLLRFSRILFWIEHIISRLTKENKKKRLKKLMFMLQVHHDMTSDELRRVFHVDTHDQGTYFNVRLGHHSF